MDIGHIDVALEIKDKFNVPEEIVLEAAKQGMNCRLSQGSVNDFFEIKDKFNVPEEFLCSLEVLEAAKQGMTYRLSYGNADDAFEIKDKFNVPEEIVLEAAKQGMTYHLFYSNADDALKIKDKFNIPEEIVLEAVKQGMTYHLSHDSVDKALEIKNKFNVKGLVEENILLNLLEEGCFDSADKGASAGLFEQGEFLNQAEALKILPSELFKIKDNLGNDFFSAEEEDKNKLIYEKLKENDVWQDEQNITEPFELGAEYFGFQKMFSYLDRPGLSRHDGLHNFKRILEIANISGLEPQNFYANILDQVKKDNSQYDEGTAHHKLNSLAGSINLNFEEIISQAKQYFEIKKLQLLLDELDSREKVFQSWKMFKKYEEICRIVQRTELLDELKELKQEGKEELYDYIETLAFHPNVSVDKVIRFWKDPEGFAGIEDSHTHQEIHDRKKPSNYFDIPNMDLKAEELRDALVEGDYDKLCVFNPLEIEYSVLKDKEGRENHGLRQSIFEAVGKRIEGKKGKSQNPGKLFSQLAKLFKEKEVNLMDYLKSNNPEQEFSQIAKFENEINELLFDEKIGLKQKTEQYRAKINLKSDPDGVTAGDDTACCMPFGSGKNNVYTFNPVCSLFTIQRKTSQDEWRTVAQSVLTKNKDIGKNVSELIQDLEKENVKMHEVVDENVLKEGVDVVACDNIEVAEGFKKNPSAERILRELYVDFFRQYLEDHGQEDNLDKDKIVIGKGYTDTMRDLPDIDNNFVPKSPIGYSDNLGPKSFLLDIAKEKNSGIIANRKIAPLQVKSRKNQEQLTSLPRGLSPLTFQDTLSVSYIEGKAYHDNESLMEYMHNMENALIAKDINNASKERSNLSLKYVDEKSIVHGYLLAYEGKRDKEGEPIVFVSDLASDGNKMAGGSLLLGFARLYKENYIDKNNPLPILAQLREKTSYPLIKKQLEKLTKDTGLKFIIEEEEENEVGGEMMHEVIIRPEKK